MNLRTSLFACLIVLVIGTGAYYYFEFYYLPTSGLYESDSPPSPKVQKPPAASGSALTETPGTPIKLVKPAENRTLAAAHTALVAAHEAYPPMAEEDEKLYTELGREVNEQVTEKGLSPVSATLVAQYDYLYHLERQGYATQYDRKRFDKFLKTFKSGKDPFAEIHDVLLRGYLSPVDNTVQHYSVAFPEGYDPDKRYPLLVSLHHHGWVDWFRPFQGHPAPTVEGAIVISPHGRGSADYMWVAAEEVFAAIEDIQKVYAIDSERIYATGYSMGGTGSWYLASRRPDIFAAIAPVAGNADFTAWVDKWDWKLVSDTPFAFLRQYLRESTCPAAYAENLRNVAVLCHHGKLDEIVPVEHARGMVQKLRALGYEKVEYVESQAAHAQRPLDELWEWMRNEKLDPYPVKVTLKTNALRHNSAYYVSLLRRKRYDRYAQLDLIWSKNVEIITDNVSAFELEVSRPMLQKLPWEGEKKFIVDGDSFALQQRTGNIYFTRTEDTWIMSLEPPAQKGKKRPGLEGPIEDAFVSPFLLVYGTIGENERLSAASKEEVLRFQRNWRKRYNKPCPAKADTEVTDSDFKQYNLILYGTPWSNSVLRSIGDKLPFVIERDGIVPVRPGASKLSGEGVGCRFICPNPKAKDKYVVVNASPTASGMYGIDFRFGNWFDWIPYDNRAWYDYCVFDARLRSPETFLESGYFDSRWAFSKMHHYEGIVEDRLNVSRMVYPESQTPEQEETVYLDSFRPVHAQTLKGFFNLRRSWDGKKLRAFGREFEHGIGARIDSHLIWHVGSAYSSFKAEIGIDYGGVPLEKIPYARTSVEMVGVKVVGDDRLLEEQVVDSSSGIIELDIDITGVKYLSLILTRETPQGWLYGSATWGNARITR
ncbi:MAG: NPCBM/NEW2 domain-containing protein [Planctomycetota bacterium]|nr:NPCBM/NEW2 domain-containing protein [Planctomycetota bacterium]